MQKSFLREGPAALNIAYKNIRRGAADGPTFFIETSTYKTPFIWLLFLHFMYNVYCYKFTPAAKSNEQCLLNNFCF